MSEAAAAKTAFTLLPPFEKERPKASSVLDWVKAAKALISADQRSLIEGTTPRSLLVYTPATVPPLVTANEGQGITHGGTCLVAFRATWLTDCSRVSIVFRARVEKLQWCENLTHLAVKTAL